MPSKVEIAWKKVSLERKEKELAQAIEQTSKKNDKFKFGIDIAERIGFAADGIRKEILNLTGRDIGNVANSISFDDALRVANVEQYLSDVRTLATYSFHFSPCQYQVRN